VVQDGVIGKKAAAGSHSPECNGAALVQAEAGAAPPRARGPPIRHPERPRSRFSPAAGAAGVLLVQGQPLGTRAGGGWS
jgi:hypothetical protein